MSELKATTSGEIRARDALLGYWWYEKSEADKVFADLEKRAQLDIKQEEFIRHHKYKRCLAMAKYWVAVSYQCVDDKHRQQAECRHKKWLELAKQFKEEYK